MIPLNYFNGCSVHHDLHTLNYHKLKQSSVLTTSKLWIAR